MSDDDAPARPDGHIDLDKLSWAEIVTLLDAYGVPPEQREAILDGIGCPCCTPTIVIPAGGKTPRF